MNSFNLASLDTKRSPARKAQPSTQFNLSDHKPLIGFLSSLGLGVLGSGIAYVQNRRFVNQADQAKLNTVVQHLGEDNVRSILEEHHGLPGSTKATPLRDLWQLPGVKTRLLDRLNDHHPQAFEAMLKMTQPYESQAKRYNKLFNGIAGLGALGTIGSWIWSMVDQT